MVDEDTRIGLGRRGLLQAVGGAAALGIGATAAHRALHGPATVVGEVGELESVFAGLQPNQTVYIDGANAPYRTTEWLDIDVDGVTGNHVREPGRDGILVEGDAARAGHEVTDNLVVAPPAARAGIPLDAGGVRVRDNHADGDDPWEIASPTAHVRDHTPPVDVHRDLTPERPEGEITVAFDRRYAHPPQLSFGRRAGAIRDATLRTDGDGDGAYVGATVSVADAGGPLDVFVNGL